MTAGIPDLFGTGDGGTGELVFDSQAEYQAWAIRHALRMTGNGPPQSGVAARSDLEDTSRTPLQGQMTVAALDALLPVPYGRPYAGALIANIFTLGENWVFWLIWGEGPVDSFVGVYLNDEALPAGSSTANYLGSAAGDLDATLVSCFAAQGITYSEKLPNVCYSVVQIPFAAITAEPRFNAELKGIKIARLSEAQRNLLQRSNEVSHSAWANINTPILGALVADPVGNLTAQPIQDDNGGAFEGRSQVVTVANDSLSYVASVYVKKTSSSVPSFGVNLYFTGGTPLVYVRLKTDTGAASVTSGSGTATVVDHGTYWRLILPALANNSSGKTTLTLELYPACCTAGTFTDSASVTGSATVCWAQIEKASTVTDYQSIVSTYATDATPQWTDCPALILRDYLESTRWGAGKTVQSHGVENCVVANNAVLGTAPNTEVARTCNLMLDREASVESWVETLRTAAGCFLAENQGVIKLVPDIDSTPIATYDHNAGQIMELSAELCSPASLPTVIEVTYTDTSARPWRDATTDPVQRPGVDTGTTPYRKSVVEMRWITRASQAAREATERMNKLWLRSITGNLQVFDEGLRHEHGDLLYVTYPDAGFASLPVRVLTAEPTALGWALAIEKHDPGAYSATVLAGPTNPNTNLPLPSAPPAMGAITVAEDVYAVQTGLYGSRIKVSWTPVDWPFLSYYVITVTQAGELKETGVAQATEAVYLTKALTENLQYLVSVAIVSTTGAIGTAAVATITNSGKSAKPADITRFDVSEIGGEVRMSWDPVSDLDWTGVELRYGSTSSSWSTATLLDRVAAPALRYSTRQIPEGVARIFIKGLDSVRSATYPYGQESVNAVYKDVTVTFDTMAFVADQASFVGPPTLKNMVASGATWVTSFGQTWGSLFTLAMSNYPNAIARYHTAGTSGLWTEIIDFGYQVTGDFSITGDFQSQMVYSELDGVGATRVLQLNAVGGEATKSVTGATNATPIVMTVTAHAYNTGDEIVQSGVGGNTAANGRFLVTVLTADTYSLQDFAGNNIAGNGAYTTGGTASRWVWDEYTASVIRTTARYARQKISTTGTLVVSSLGQVSVNVVAQPDSGTASLDGDSDTDATVVSFNKWFTAMKSIVLTPASGTTNAFSTYDQVEVSRGLGLQSGRYLRFDGSTQYASRNSVVCGNAITVECWIKPQQWGTGQAQMIWCLPNDGNGSGSGTPTTRFGLQVSGDGVKVCMNAGDTTTNWFANATTGAWVVQPTVGQWTHTAVVVTAAAVAILYYNGVEVGRAQFTRDPTNTSTARTWRIGSGPSAGYYKGCIDAFRVWNEARSAANILANYLLELTTATNLLINWNLNETSGTTVSDDSGNGYSATITGYATALNRRMWRPYDGFDLYTFDAAGAQKDSATVSAVSWSALGI